MDSNPQLELAWEFVNNTDRNIFLTGKAGTGKTTFLHRLKAESLKRMAVVAPTGVAAINAGGVTIHSFFQLPFGPILPETTSTQGNSFSKKFSKNKINIIKSLDLLVIDEVSMVRADLLDGIDQVLRRFRDRTKPFGGAQLLMIGDLQQLSPVIKDDEWQLLKQHYTTGFFFGSKVFQSSNALCIELKHIYRQESEDFIKILNEIRNDCLTPESSETLNKRFVPGFSASQGEGYITLTTHNNRADRINSAELKKLKKKSLIYEAEIEGKFPEYTFPTHLDLELKVGAQVMFVKNDSSPEKRYFNGKIGKIVSLDKKEVLVRCPGDNFNIVTTPEIWRNIQYSINPESKEIKEDEIGSFSQIPLRLAWAITIHKSQGLTFEKVIIDAQEAFAHGQTYVALSRCKTLEGIVLTGPLSQKSIINNQQVASFNKDAEANQPDVTVLNDSQKAYQLNLIGEVFNFYAFLHPVSRIIDIYYNNKGSVEGNLLNQLTLLKERGITELLKINHSFKFQLQKLSEEEAPVNNPILQERFKKAIAYFEKHTLNHIKKPLNELRFTTDNKAVKQEITKHLDTLEDLLGIKIYCFKGLKSGFETLKYLDLRAKASLEKEEQPRRNKADFVATTEHMVLFETLRELRSVLSEEEGIPPYQVFTQKALYEMCEVLPTNASQLRKISDIGKIRLEKYGAEILEVIREYCEENNIVAKKPTKKIPKKSGTKQISFDLFKAGKSISEIALERNLTVGTIEGHLTSFLASGEIEITELMPEKKFLEIKNIIETIPYEGFSDLKSKIDDTFSYSDLRMVLNTLQYEKETQAEKDSSKTN
ncbi:helix-turn-helix domain-containing protein [Aequorivita viscosa]|uniref:UvrD-like helicase C-terminal domain-containing protein n=1 Tax=Aequorivita viscosa TaxID=797419 RepID=A0A1M6B9M7_9FLAO|nr:helix-turn-helix domain-containing protein [Aequorivita viscosa]SDW34552.1 UvrD-like helicase C-terminal domain-containing protein [Aequorivita viscosa]SHI45464.1 UvrD-like helicase C-terminal domain-containing protein [Aequorivita viscosa]